MKLTRLIYASYADLDLRLSDIKDILEVARAKNEALGVCGMLYYNTKYFLQALEGDDAAVKKVYHTISDDYRHDGLHVIAEETIDAPRFSGWSMGYAGNSKAIDDFLNQMGIANGDFTQLHPEQCLQLLVEAEQHQEF